MAVVVAIDQRHFIRARRGRKTQICRWNFDALRHSSRDISISGLAATLLFPVVHQYCIYLGILSLSIPWSQILLLPVEVQ